MQIRIFNQNIWGNMGGKECIGNRNVLISELVKEFDADICGFQECNPQTSRKGENDISLLLQDIYEEVPTVANRENFTPIFFKRNKLSVVASGWRCYKGLNDLNSKSLTWCVFEDKNTKIRLAYVNTHFWWHFGQADDNLQRLQNVDELHETVMDIRENYSTPVVITGDMNCGEESAPGMEPIKKLQKMGYVRISDIAKYKEGFYTVHEYPIRNDQGIYHGESAPTFTLDHALLYPDNRIEICSFVIDSSIKALSTSDHCPLYIHMDIS